MCFCQVTVPTFVITCSAVAVWSRCCTTSTPKRRFRSFATWLGRCRTCVATRTRLHLSAPCVSACRRCHCLFATLTVRCSRTAAGHCRTSRTALMKRFSLWLMPVCVLHFPVSLNLMIMFGTQTLVYWPVFQDNLGIQVPECWRILGFIAARDNRDGSGDNQNPEICKSFAPSSS